MFDPSAIVLARWPAAPERSFLRCMWELAEASPQELVSALRVARRLDLAPGEALEIIARLGDADLIRTAGSVSSITTLWLRFTYRGFTLAVEQSMN